MNIRCRFCCNEQRPECIHILLLYFLRPTRTVGEGVIMNILKTTAIAAKRSRKVREFIDVEKFLYFYSHHAFDEIGMDKKGLLTNLQFEIGEVTKLANAGFVGELALEEASFYKSRNLYSMVEMSEEERAERSSKLFNRAAAKILWLNAKCKELTDVPFLNCRVDKSNPVQVRELVVAFCDAIDR